MRAREVNPAPVTVNAPIGEAEQHLGIYRLAYECAKCGVPYAVDWNPGEAEPASACPACGSPVRRFLSSVRVGEWRGTVHR